MTSDTKLKHLVILLKEKGGTGATEVASMLAAAGVIGGSNVAVCDGDNNVRSYRRRFGKDSAHAVPDVGTTPAEFAKRKLDGSDLIILDLPGGFAGRTDAEASWVWSLISLCENAGRSLHWMFVSSANSPGTIATAISLAGQLTYSGHRVVVFNDAHGGGAFERAELPSGWHTAQVCYIPPGIIAAMRRRCIPMDEQLRFPEPGFAKAAAFVARSMVQLLAEPAFAAFLPEFAEIRLRKLGAGSPVRLNYTIPDAVHAHDELLELNEQMSRVNDQLISRWFGRAVISLVRRRQLERQFDRKLEVIHARISR